MEKNYKIEHGVIYIWYDCWSHWCTISEILEETSNDEQLAEVLTRLRISEKIEDLIIATWTRVKMERLFRKMKAKENKERILNKIRLPII